MSSVKVTDVTASMSGTTVQADVTFDVTFTDTEKRLDVAFIPTVYITPSLQSTQDVRIDQTTLSTVRCELAFPQGSVRPSGKDTVTVTATVSADKSSLFKSYEAYALLWVESNRGVDARVDLAIDITLGASSLLRSGVIPAPPAFGTAAVEFDGATYVACIWTNLPITTQVTVEMWMRGLPRDAYLFYLTDNHGRRQLSAHVPYLDGNVYFDAAADVDNNYDRISQALSPADDKSTWNHWAFVRDSAAGRMAIYRNGVLWLEQATGLTRQMAACNAVMLGADREGEFRHQGAITEFRVWNVARTAAQIKDNMNRRIPGADEGLIVSWALDQDYMRHASVKDRSGGMRPGEMRSVALKTPGPSALV